MSPAAAWGWVASARPGAEAGDDESQDQGDIGIKAAQDVVSCREALHIYWHKYNGGNECPGITCAVPLQAAVHSVKFMFRGNGHAGMKALEYDIRGVWVLALIGSFVFTVIWAFMFGGKMLHMLELWLKEAVESRNQNRLQRISELTLASKIKNEL
jgi:hypothetical protein